MTLLGFSGPGVPNNVALDRFGVGTGGNCRLSRGLVQAVPRAVAVEGDVVGVFGSGSAQQRRPGLIRGWDSAGNCRLLSGTEVTGSVVASQTPPDPGRVDCLP